MRICHVVEASGGGVGQVIIDLVRSGLAAGQDITVVYGIARATPYFIQTLESALGDKFVPISMQREVGPHDIADAWSLYHYLRQLGPFDVIHGHSSKAGALVRMTGLFFPRAVKIYSPHAFMTLDSCASRIYGVFEKILSWLPGTIVTLSAVEEQHAVKDIGINPRKIVVIPNGIKLEYPVTRADARRVMGYGDDTFVAGFVGRFVPQKNPLRLIEAFAEVLKSNPSMQLALIGDGILKSRMETLIAERKIEGNVRFFSGYAGRDVIPALDCLVCPSDYEGFAIIYLEALAAGVPIVTTPVGGAHETVVEGKTGFMTSGFQVSELASAILKIANLTSAQYKLMSENARQHAQNFSLDSVAKRLHALYVALLNKLRGRHS